MSTDNPTPTPEPERPDEASASEPAEPERPDEAAASEPAEPERPDEAAASDPAEPERPDDAATTAAFPPPPPLPPPAKRGPYRRSADRVIGGVCGGLADRFGIDVTFVRVLAVVLTVLLPVLVAAYVATVALAPSAEGEAVSERDRRYVLIGTASALVLAVGFIGLGFFWFPAAVLLVPVALLILVGAFVGRGQPASTSGRRTLLLVLGLLAAAPFIVVGGFAAAALGGGVAMAIAVVVAGALLVAAAFSGGLRWLAVPALLLAIPVATVAAADIDLRGGFAERTYRPATVADVPTRLHLGAGRLRIDLRDVQLPPGDRRLAVELGAGDVELIVPDDLCVAVDGRIGIGALEYFDEEEGGFDVDLDRNPRARTGRPRLVLDADVDAGVVEVSHFPRDDGRLFDGPRRFRFSDGDRDTACAGSA